MYINHVSSYLPAKKLSNQDLNLIHPEWSAEKISAKTGIYLRSVSNKNEFASHLAENAAHNLITINNIDKNSIDCLIICTQSPDYLIPTTACLVQERLGLKKNIAAFDVNQGCSGYIYSLAIAKGMVSSGIVNKILLITVDTYTKFIHKNDRVNKTIFGDGASASLISSDAKGFEIGDFVFGTDGSGACNLILQGSGARGFSQIKKSDNEKWLFMNGPEIFSFTSQQIPILVKKTLKKNNLLLKDVDHFIFHQANKFMLNHIRKKCEIPEEKFIIDLENTGNTVSSTVPIVLSNLNKDIKLNTVLLAGFGVGYSMGGCIIKQIN